MKGLNPWVISKVGWVWWSWWTLSNTQTNVNSGPVTTATVPYIRGTSETIARILQPCNIRVAHKPIITLRRPLTNVRDTARLLTLAKPIEACLSTRLSENKRAKRNGDVNNHITDETSNRLGLCDMYYVFYKLLSTTYFRKLVYYFKTNATES